LRGQEHRIDQVWGPERIETGWWRGPMVARDYYRVETALGRRFWLFRRLADGRWFLHGPFE
jgi:protein ImuB